MPTEQDYHLQPQSGPLSKVICNHCDSDIGEVYTAATTPTGARADAPNEEELTKNILDLVRDHLEQCHQGQGDDITTYENESSRPPERAKMKHQR